MKSIAQAIAAVGFAAIGMAGIFLNIENAGWILAFGIIMAMYL